MNTFEDPAESASHVHVEEKTLFGHPHGLYFLFFTELWERFSFYTMRGILVLYMVAVVFKAMAEEVASGRADGIYGAYLGFVYASTFVGGMLADRLLGQRRAIYIGGTLMAIAQFTLATHALLVFRGHDVLSLNWLFFLGLGLLSAGNGFFKPNISTIVGTLYKQGDARRDGAFTIFYMGINIGALLASFSAGFAQKIAWHWGFIMAGAGMVVGQIIFIVGLKTLRGKGLPPETAKLSNRGLLGLPNYLTLTVCVLAFIPLAAYLISMPRVTQVIYLSLAAPVLAYLIWEATRGTKEEAGRMLVILVLCTFSMVFWGFFELAGSTITRFTEVAVNKNLFGIKFEAAFLANFFNPLLIIGLSIPVAALWTWLDRIRMEPSSPFKFVFGLGFLSLGFVMLLLGAMNADSNGTGECSIAYLILGFFFHTTGELCLSPVGLSTITKLSPARLVGMFMGVWFLASSLGNVLAPWVAGVGPDATFVDVFKRIAIITGVGAFLLLLLVRPLKKMMYGVK
ncbi:MAG: peptide MFS transporter [Phycisphaerales bacterium]|nr:peptide MFS transporter [Phycisphaerales bacterium]MCB9863547.1 peptide MFS transporter [Phycisphaerales bacterium]